MGDIMEVSTISNFTTSVSVGEGMPFGNWLSNTIAIDGFDDRRKQLTRLNLVVPVAFFEARTTYRCIYVEVIRAYLYGVPNASVSLISKCLEVALRNKLLTNGASEVITIKGKKVRLSDTGLYGLIESDEGSALLGDRKEEATYLRQLRNHIHDARVVNDVYALQAISHMHDIILTLYPNPQVVYVRYTCSYCRQQHAYTLNSSNYYPGASYTFKCHNQPPQLTTTQGTSSTYNRTTDTWFTVNI